MRRSMLAAAVALTLCGPAQAALFVSGDSNIFGSLPNPFTALPANQQFLRNIAGGKVLLQNTDTGFLSVQIPVVADWLTSQGIANTVLAVDAEITAADLAGASLFVGYAPFDAYTAGELAALLAFLDGGANVLLTGDNLFPNFTVSNAAVNEALDAWGSDIDLVPGLIDSAFNTAVILSDNIYTTGTAGFQFAATSSITGGVPLYGTLDGTPFLVVDRFVDIPGGVPEPATWAMLILGFGLVGTAARRRRPATA